MIPPTSVGPIGGPGSVNVSLRVSLWDFRNQLIRAGHPLANAPQWNGGKVWLVVCDAKGIEERHPEYQTRALVIRTKSEDRARMVALANLDSRHGPKWQVCSSEEIKFGSQELLSNVEISLPHQGG